MNKIYIGIDIGKQGAIAMIFPDNKIVVEKVPMIKTELDYASLPPMLNQIGYTSHVVFEKLGIIFGSGKQVAWSMGEQSGAIEMSCICQMIP